MNGIKHCNLSLLILLLLGVTPAHSETISHTSLREGAVMCPVNPETGQQEIYLPPIYETIIEKVVLQDAQTYLHFSPLKIGDNGERLQRAGIQERVHPAVLLYNARKIVLLPAQLVLRDESNILRSKHDLSQVINENSNIQKIFEARAKEPSEEEISALIAKTNLQKSNQRRKGISFFPYNFTPVIPENISYEDINIGKDEVFNVIQLPAKLEKRTDEVITGIKFSSISSNARCDGYNILIPPIDFERSSIASHYITEKRPRMFMVEAPQYLFFNVNGDRLKFEDLKSAGYEGYILNAAQKSDNIEFIGR